MEPLEYLRVIRRRWRLLAACVLVAGVAAWITTPARPSNDNVTYRATHQLIRDSSAQAPPSLASISVFVKTGEIPRRVAERVGFTGEPALLAARVTLKPDEQVGTLDITVTGGSAEEAAERANAFAEETLAYLGDQSQLTQREQLERVNEQLATLQVEIDDLEDRIEASGSGEGVLRAERDSKLRQYGAALDQQQQLLNQPPPSAGYVSLQEALPELASPVGGGFSAPRSRPARTAIAVVLGLLLGLAAVVAADRLDTRLHTREATEAAFGLPVIAEVPRTSMARDTIVSVVDPMSSTAEAYRSLRAALMLMPTTALGRADAAPREEPRVVLVTSPAPGDGKTTTVVNLAASFSEAGHRVLVLGCDFRRPEVHRYFDVDPRPGIADVLRDGRRALSTVLKPTRLPRVTLAPSGSSLRSLGDVAHAGRALIEEARGLADIVLIDTPPLLATNDATELIPSADAVVVVARVGRTSVEGAHRVHRLLQRLSAPAAGVVTIGGAEADAAYTGYYHSVSPQPQRRGWARRSARANELSDRIEPWRGLSPEAAPSSPRPEPSEAPRPEGSSVMPPPAPALDRSGSGRLPIGATEAQPESNDP